MREQNDLLRSGVTLPNRRRVCAANRIESTGRLLKVATGAVLDGTRLISFQAECLPVWFFP